MDSLDKEIKLQVRTKEDRPVMNASDTPEYINMATHFNEKKSDVEGYESIQFADSSTGFIETFEDEALLRGEVKPVVVKKATPVEPQVVTRVKPIKPGDVTDASEEKMTAPVISSSTTPDTMRIVNASPEIHTSNSGSVARANGTQTILPYQDIPGVFASIDTLNPEIKKEERYFTVPSSVAIFYNPIVLIFASLLLVFIIVLEFVGCIYVF